MATKTPSARTLATYVEAETYWLEHAATNDEPLSGKDLGARFGKSDRWGRQRIEAAKASQAPAEDEVSDGMPRHADVTNVERRTAIASVVIVALAAAVASFAHQHHVAHFAGEGWRAALFPLSVDGLVVAASTLMNIRRRQGVKVGALCWASLALGIAMTVAANVVAASPTIIPLPVLKGIVGAWSPIAFALASELVREVVHATRGDR